MPDPGHMRARLGLDTSLRLHQRLSPVLIEFAWLLQLTSADLEAVVSRELAENPALELADVASSSFEADVPSFSQVTSEEGDPISDVASPFTLRDHLRQSLICAPADRAIGLSLVEEIDDDGYFRGDLSEIAHCLGVSVERVEQVLLSLQELPPSGVGARDLRECLQLQLRHLQEERKIPALAPALVNAHWDLFSHHRLREVARAAGAPLAAVEAAVAFIAENLAPYPGRAFRPDWGAAASAAPPPRPDIIIRPAEPEGAGFLVDVIEPESLAVRVSKVYEEAFARLKNESADRLGTCPTEKQEHINEYLARAKAFVRHLRRRREALQRICLATVSRQQAFLERGPRYLEPLTRVEVARDLGVHESTVGRAVAGKWVLLPSRELVPFSLFFRRSRSAEEALAELLAREDRRRPWSDQALVGLLAQEGLRLSRRTVARYRRALRVPARSRRRRL